MRVPAPENKLHTGGEDPGQARAEPCTFRLKLCEVKRTRYILLRSFTLD